MSVAESSSDETESSDYNLQALRPTSSSTSSSDGEESECCPTRSLAPGHKRRIKTGFRSWSKNLSARSNQDNQRDFEEKAMKQVRDVFPPRKSRIEFKISFRSFHSYRRKLESPITIRTCRAISKGERTSSSKTSGARRSSSATSTRKPSSRSKPEITRRGSCAIRVFTLKLSKSLFHLLETKIV